MKGYRPLRAFDHAMTAQIREGDREKGGRRPKQWHPRRGTMAGGKGVTGAHGLGSTGHSLKNRGHRGREGVKGNPPRPRLRPEVMAEAVVAMASGVELSGACG